jgi:hypothetical protein
MEQVKRGIFAGLAAVALAGGAVTAAAPAASAATTQCGSACFTFASGEYGESYVSAIQSRGPEQGSVVTLAGSGNFEGEDFMSLDAGTTTQFFQDGIVPVTLAKNWPGYQLYEYEFAPFGHPSNLCIGTATAAVSGAELSLQPCGVNDQTLWLPETHDAINGFEPIIAGSDTRSTAPYVITAGSPGGALTTYEQASPERSSQLWEEIVGVLA